MLAEQVGVHQLRRHQGDAQHDAEHRRAAHLFHRRPADGHRQEHEDRFTEQPQEVVNGFPRRVHLRQRLAVGHRDVADHVAEAEDQTAADQRRQQWEEDLGEVGDGALSPGHVLARGHLGLLLVGLVDAGAGDQRLIVVADVGADHHLELPGVGEATLDHRQRFDLFRFRLVGIVEDETQPGNAMADGGDVLAAADQNNQAINILLFYFAHYGIPAEVLTE